VAVIAATAIQDVSFVDVGSGTIRSKQTVILDGASARVVSEIPAGMTVVDGHGKFLMPGLWDAHAGLGSADRRELQSLLSQGITGVRDLSTPWDRIQTLRGLTPLRIVGSGTPVEGKTPAEARAAFDQLWNLDADFVTASSGITRMASSLWPNKHAIGELPWPDRFHLRSRPGMRSRLAR